MAALRDGSLLYVEEINRIPEETLNVLITVMSEAELHVPRLGRVAASPGFRLVAAMNPFDAVGTARISSAVYDRTCRLSMDYQDAADEAAIVAARRARPRADLRWLTGVVDAGAAHAGPPRPAHRVVGAGRHRHGGGGAAPRRAAGEAPHDAGVGLDAALVALSGRVRVREGAGRTAEDVITELWRVDLRPAGG